MQITTEKRNVMTAGMRDQRQFTVNVGSHIMGVLSGLYTNPIDAMVREYMTNMYDAWLALQRENPSAEYVPCELHVPTPLSPYLVFKDYGIGMDRDTVWNVYTSYGSSTKNTNNDEVGGFGLGSKTAFCYNNGQQWTIESRYNGTHMTFMAFIGEDGVPTLVDVHSQPTTERNGVTVRIPIVKNDINAVVKAVDKYVPYFPVGIKIVNHVVNPVSYTLRGDNWGFRCNSPAGYGNDIRIIMGNVPYTLNTNLVSVRDTFAYANALDLYVPVGAVDVVPSRDALKYSDRTKQYITDLLQSHKHDFVKMVHHRFATVDTEYQARGLYNEFFNSIYGFGDLVKTVKYRNGVIGTGRRIGRNIEDIRVLDPVATMTMYHITSSHKGTPDIKENGGYVFIGSESKNTVIIINDVKNGATVAKGWCYSKLVVRGRTNRPLKYGHAIGGAVLLNTSLSVQQIADMFGGIPHSMIVKASEVSDVAARIPKQDRNATVIYKYDSHKFVPRAKLPTTGTVYYLPLTQNEYNNRYEYRGKLTIYDVTRCKMFGVSEVYGIREADVANVVNGDARFVNLETYVKSKHEEWIKTNSIDYHRYRLWNGDSFSIVRRLMNAITACRVHDPLFSQIRDEYIKIESLRSSDVAVFIRTMDANTLTIPANKNPNDLVNNVNTLMKRFPMFRVLETLTNNNMFNTTSSINDKLIAEYVQMMIANGA